MATGFSISRSMKNIDCSNARYSLTRHPIFTENPQTHYVLMSLYLKKLYLMGGEAYCH